MARLLHPSYFPATRQAPNCEYWGGFDIPLEKKMEAYWRVKKWSINISATFNEGASTTGASGILDVSSRGNEANLVCPGFVLKELTPIGEMISVGAFIDASGFGVEGTSFDDIFLSWPANIVENVPVILKIGNYQKNTFASLFGAYQGAVDSSTGLIEAVEWWPYEDANGNPLYNTSTGQRI